MARGRRASTAHPMSRFTPTTVLTGFLRWLVGAAALALLLALLVSVAQVGPWWLLVVGSLRVQIVVAGLVLVLLGLALRGRKATLAALLAVGVGVALSGPGMLLSGGLAQVTGPVIGVLALNVQDENLDFEGTSTYVAQLAPDIAVFAEVNDPWRSHLRRTLGPMLPHRAGISGLQGDQWHNTFVMSRWPIEDVDYPSFGGQRGRAVRATVQTDYGAINILAVHLAKPSTAAQFERQNRQLEEIAEMVSQGGPWLVLGDWNATGFDPRLAPLAGAGLTGTPQQRTYALRGSWPSALPALAVGIDHIMHSPALALTELEVGPNLGSNHRPLWARLGFQQAPGL